MSRSSYRDIQDEVSRRIQERIWQPGEIIPSEVELAKEFDCARVTINRALRALAETGVLDRKRKAGTRVSLNPVRKATLEIPVVRLEIEARGGEYRHGVLQSERVVASPTLRARMDLEDGTEVLHLRCLHLSDGQPYLYEDRWVNLATVPEILTESFEKISANEWLVQNTPFTRGDIAFLSQEADADDAEALGINKGAALFIIERLTWHLDRAITLVRLAYPPGYRMTTQI